MQLRTVLGDADVDARVRSTAGVRWKAVPAAAAAAAADTDTGDADAVDGRTAVEPAVGRRRDAAPPPCCERSVDDDRG